MMVNYPICNDNELVCPGCGDTMLHHGKVVVKNRKSEDADGTFVTVDRQEVSTSAAAADDFDGRRNSLTIEFVCENCHAGKWIEYLDKGENPGRPPFEFTIIQHKGRTLFGWFMPDVKEQRAYY